MPSPALQPFPLRISPLQLAQLQELRDVDSITVQEHIRRAIGAYIENVRAKREAYPPPPVHLVPPTAGQRKPRATFR